MAPSANSPVVVPTVYAAIELSKKSWVVAVARPDRSQPSLYRIAGGRLDELVTRLRRSAKDGEQLLVCYEAGYDGFWLARSLTFRGIDCRVLDPASLQVNRRARRAKTDRIDVLMLLRALIAIDRGDHHVAAIVRVPSVEEEDARRSHRERQRLIRERSAHINRIKGLLFAQGIRGADPSLRSRRIDFAALRTRKACRSHPGFARNSRENMPASTWWNASCAPSRASGTQPTRRTRQSNGSGTCWCMCAASALRVRPSSAESCSPDRSPTGGSWDPISG
jgi:hypothetical protein